MGPRVWCDVHVIIRMRLTSLTFVLALLYVFGVWCIVCGVWWDQLEVGGWRLEDSDSGYWAARQRLHICVFGAPRVMSGLCCCCSYFFFVCAGLWSLCLCACA
uniref:Transmembrane protein n=1 Tax=Palpitomonas bilix TaxID=652834 RepID=A0A7S3G234_9EUKA|mmetsp:Transcript_12395/g.33196  ORF Transcript_12395/g.33196 Transcript_12395/m.33196 type:complete len:103 (+) Transcript_12395:72-380(+)